MITKNGKELLNLENTVGKLVELVEGHYEVDRVIADYGITMVNQRVDSPAQLEGVRGTKWGEAYPVGYEPPYDIYIWTRPTVDTTNVADGAWFNVGKMAIPGPVGPAGESIIGPRGENVRWFIGSSLAEAAEPRIGDLYLMDNNAAVPGDVYLYGEYGWGLPRINIIGPKGNPGVQGRPGESIVGPVGPAGPKGDTAPVITLIGIVASPDEFDEPTASLVGRGYILEQAGGINSVWTPIETEPGVYEWEMAGTISGYSVVTSGGNVQPTWNADTKLDKNTAVTELNQVYIKTAAGEEAYINVTKQARADAVVQRQSDGNIIVPNTPAANEDAASKKYVDNLAATKVTINLTQTRTPQVYCKSATGGANGTQMRNLIADLADGSDNWPNHQYTVAQRDSIGALRGPNPTSASQYATKQYVDTNATPKLYQHIIRSSGYGYTADGSIETYAFTAPIISTKSTAINSPFGIWQDLRNNTDTAPVVLCPTHGYDSQGNTILQITFYKDGKVLVESGYADQVEQDYLLDYIENAGIYDTVSPIL